MKIHKKFKSNTGDGGKLKQQETPQENRKRNFIKKRKT